jgi:hypothetical protein
MRLAFLFIEFLLNTFLALISSLCVRYELISK